MRYVVWMMLVILAGCKYDDGLQQHTVADEFTVWVAGYMEASNKLHPDARFQYENRFRTVYLLLLRDDPKQYTSLQDYGNFATEELTSVLEDVKIEPIDSVTAINGAPALEYEIHGNMTRERIFYDLAVVEGKSYYYRVVSWTIGPRKPKYYADIKAMVSSFKPLN